MDTNDGGEEAVDVDAVDMSEQITISRQELRDGFLAWERMYEAGDCLSQEETAQLPTEEKAYRSADAMFDRLKEEQQNG